MDEISELRDIEYWRTEIEKVMLSLPENSRQFHKTYLSGWVDGHFEAGQITDEQRDTLHLEYAE